MAQWVVRQRERWQIRRFFFVDECVHPGFALGFARALEKYGVADCHFVAMARPEPAFDREVLSAVARVGFEGLLWGMESSSDRVLRLMRKGTKVRSILEVLRCARDVGLSNFLFLMIGFPGETPDEARATIEFLRRHRDQVDGAQLSRFVVYEASDIGQHPERYGVILDRDDEHREVGAVGVAGGTLDRAFLDGLYSEFEQDYFAFVSGRVPSALHHFSSARSLLLFLYRDLAPLVSGDEPQGRGADQDAISQ